MKTAAILLLLVVCFAGCRKNKGSEITPEPEKPEYAVDVTPYGDLLRLPSDSTLSPWTEPPGCRSWEYYDRGGQKKTGYATGSVFYLGFFADVKTEERVRVLKKWGLFRRTNGTWIQTYNPTLYNQCYFVHTPDSLTTCAQQAAFMNRLLGEPAIKFANPLLMYRPIASRIDRILDELNGEAAPGYSDEQLAEILSSFKINFVRRQVANQPVYTLIVPKGERNALDWATLLIGKGYFRILYPPSFDDGRAG